MIGVLIVIYAGIQPPFDILICSWWPRFAISARARTMTYSDRFRDQSAISLTMSSRMTGCVCTYFSPTGDLKKFAIS